MDATRNSARIPDDRSYPDTPDVPLRIFVGAAEWDMIPARVLEHSIRKHASRPVEFVPMLRKMPVPKRRRNRAVTGFSFQRFMIPRLCGYRGRALYMDSDMLVFGDVAELWKLPFREHRVICSLQMQAPDRWRNPEAHFHPGRNFAVMLLDCSRLDWDADAIVRDLDQGRITYKDLMSDMCVVPHEEIGETLDPAWNSLETYEPGVTRNLHFTVIQSQPWRFEGNPLEQVWWRAYRDAIEQGVVDYALVARAVRRRWCRPELLDEFTGGRAARDGIGFKLSAAATRSAFAVRRALLGRKSMIPS